MEAEDGDDPVTAEYNVFMTPQLQEKLYLLQYPSRRREEGYNAANQAKPSELRIKPKSGFMELDIGVTVEANFDRVKGMQWGQALKHAKDSGSTGFGLSSGFGKGNRSTELIVSGRAKKKGDEDVESMLREFDEMNSRGRVLTKQTLGGQIVGPKEGMPVYMLGTFKENELHLHEIAGMTQMRPQFHYLDAQAQITKTTVARAQMQKPKAAEQARAITQTQRNDPSESETSRGYREAEDFLTAASGETWARITYHDEEEEESYRLFDSTMFLKDTANATNLQSEWNKQQYLDAINEPIIEIDTKQARTRKPTVKGQKQEPTKATGGAARK